MLFVTMTCLTAAAAPVANNPAQKFPWLSVPTTLVKSIPDVVIKVAAIVMKVIRLLMVVGITTLEEATGTVADTVVAAAVMAGSIVLDEVRFEG